MRAPLTRLTPLLLSPLRTRMMAGTAAIEVEKKFAAGDPSALRQQVEASGGKTLGEISFHDEYWDTAECVLTRRPMVAQRAATGAKSSLGMRSMSASAKNTRSCR